MSISQSSGSGEICKGCHLHKTTLHDYYTNGLSIMTPENAQKANDGITKLLEGSKKKLETHELNEEESNVRCDGKINIVWQLKGT